MSDSKKKGDVTDYYVSLHKTFEKSLNGSGKIPFNKVRKEALASFAEQGFPTKRNEYYKYNNFKPLQKQRFEVPGEVKLPSAETVEKLFIPGLESIRVVFINGRYVPEFSNLAALPKTVMLGSLADLLAVESPVVYDHLASYAGFQEDTFIALNTAFAQDGLFAHVPEGTVVETPVEALFISDLSAGGFLNSPRNVVVAEANSVFTLIENHVVIGGAESYLNNMVTEIRVDENARMDHIKIQNEHLESAHHIHNLRVQQEKGSYYSLVNADLGGKQVRNNFNAHLGGENCENHFIGFYMGTGKQEIDNHTFINHAMPHCESNELYKGILGGKATGIFNGKIYVAQDAQKTNAYQNNKALLLSDDATINSKPELEIFADDVKCSHGATVGQLDGEALFYLRARGIPEDRANAILQFAFASDVFSYVKNEAVNHYLNDLVFQRFSHL
ncbi:MAG: Fe-S cluster assembly protein SufD [Calditrichaeota bacterium]|nr:Fe-S cluster assembly protein SufD [Calditrichota bacterium]